MKRLVVMGEGEGEERAAPWLVRKVLQGLNVHDVHVVDNAMRVGELPKLIKDDYANWKRFLKAAKTAHRADAVLLLIDGDCPANSLHREFCARSEAIRLTEVARSIGAGTTFSAGIVFACMEFESWCLWAAESLRGRSFPDGRAVLKAKTEALPPDPENGYRDAKGWLNRNLATGYSPTRDQEQLVRLIDWSVVAEKKPRSFVRLQSALSRLADAVRAGVHISDPVSKK